MSNLIHSQRFYMGNTTYTPADQARWQVPSYLRRRTLPRIPATNFLARPAANDPTPTSWQQQARARAAARQAAAQQQTAPPTQQRA